MFLLQRIGTAMLLCIVSLQLGFGQSALDQYEKGLLAQREGNIAIAKDYFTKAINMEQGNGAFYLSRGNLILNNQDNPKIVDPENKLMSYLFCLEDFSKAIALMPDSYESYFGRGKINYLISNFPAAKSDYDKAVKLSYYLEDKIQALVGRAAALYRMNEIEGAFRDLERAEDYDSTNVYVLNEMALIYIGMNEPEIALKTLNKVLVQYPNDPIANANIGFAAIKAGRYQKAIQIYNRCLDTQGASSYIFSNRGFCKYKLGDFPAALNDLNQAIELDANNVYAYKNRALVFLAQEDRIKGCEDLEYSRTHGYTKKYDQEVIQLLGENCWQVNKKPK